MIIEPIHCNDEVVPLFPERGSVRDPTQTIRIEEGVLIGTLHYFNHIDNKWVFCVDSGWLHFRDQTKRPVDGVKLILLAGNPPPQHDPFEHKCFEGPPGSDPYILRTWENDPETLPGRGYGLFTTATCKKRKYRLDALNAILWFSDGTNGEVMYFIDRLYVEVVYKKA